MKKYDHFKVKSLIQTAVDPYIFSDFNFDPKKEEAFFVYKEIKYSVRFTQKKGKIIGAVVHYLDNGYVYQSDLADLIQVCILHQIEKDSLISKLPKKERERFC